MARPKSNGPYAKLSATYYDDDAVIEAGPHAELLWVRYLAFTAASPSDGYVTDRQMRARVGRGLRDVPGRVRTLVEVGLLDVVAGGYVSRSWQKWNKSAEEIGKYHAKDRERKARKHAEVFDNSARNEGDVRSDSSDQDNTSQDSTTTPLGVVRASRRKPEIPLPDDWKPKPSHVTYALERGVDGRHEEGQFRAHAAANDRRQRDWDQAFRGWLGNARPSKATPMEKAKRTVMLATELLEVES